MRPAGVEGDGWHESKPFSHIWPPSLYMISTYTNSWRQTQWSAALQRSVPLPTWGMGVLGPHRLRQLNTATGVRDPEMRSEGGLGWLMVIYAFVISELLVILLKRGEELPSGLNLAICRSWG